MNSLFDSLNTQESGGALNVASKKIFISSSYFNNCTATRFGGCIFVDDSYFDLKSTLFLNSCVKTNIDSYYGNAIYCANASYTNIYCISTRLCGYSNISGDSPIRVDK